MHSRFKVKTIEVEVSKLRLHDRANRETVPARVRKYEKDMDLDKLGRLSAWRAGRDLYVIDGQHRKLALEALGMGDWKVRVDVYEGLTFEDACHLFLGLNDSMLVRAFDKFDKAAKAGYEAEVETLRIIREHGLEISPQAGDGKVPAVAAALDVYKMDRGEALSRALDWAIASWGTPSSSFEGNILRGLGLVATSFNGEVDDAAMVKKLAKFAGGPGSLVGKAKGQREIKGGTVGRNVAQIVVDIYNKGRRSGQLAPL